MHDPYITLGLKTGEGASEATATLERLERKLDLVKSPADARAKETALEAARKACTLIRDGHKPEPVADQENFNARLRLGQLCLSSGMISIDQLAEAVREQKATDRQLGEILQAMELISQEELDGLLMAQDLIGGDVELDRDAQRLIALDLLTEEIVTIALLEKRFASSSLEQVLARRGWLSSELYLAIFS